MSITDSTAQVFGGRRPGHTGDLTPETAGIAPVPPADRYARTWWMLPMWFTPNMEVSAVFIGTLGAVLGLGFRWGAVALAIGIVLGAIPVAYLSTWGPPTGAAQIPLASLPFGKSVIAPAFVQWISAIGWISIGCFFGAQAGQLLFHIPFWTAALIVLVLEAAISVWGYEIAIQAMKWGAVLMVAFFVLLTVRIFQHHVVLPVASIHGAALAAGVALMVAIALSGSFSWASYGSDYSRYCKTDASKAAVFWFTLAGISLSYLWLSFIGLAAASLLSDQTAGGIRSIVGGGALGEVALAAIVIAAFISSAINDYSGSLAFQALQARVKRPLGSAIAAAVAFGIILWMHAGNLSTRFENVLLFTGYWLSPFLAIVLYDWYRNHQSYDWKRVQSILNWRALPAGWPALVSFLVGFGAMVPFMDTSIIVGPVAKSMDGADTAYYVGFIVTGILYVVLCKITDRTSAPVPAAAGQEATPGTVLPGVE